MTWRPEGPIHPAVVHFPVAAFSVLPVLDVLLLTGYTHVFKLAVDPLAKTVLIAGLLSAFLAACAGVFDSVWLPDDKIIRNRLQRHLQWILASLAVFFTALLVRLNLLGSTHELMFAVLDFTGFFLLCTGAHQGGKLAHLHWPFQTRL